jgi:hypothetical protein
MARAGHSKGNAMKKATCNSTNCVTYSQLADIHMSAIMRRRAEHALRDAHVIVDAVLWVMNSRRWVGARFVPTRTTHSPRAVEGKT